MVRIIRSFLSQVKDGLIYLVKLVYKSTEAKLWIYAYSPIIASVVFDDPELILLHALTLISAYFLHIVFKFYRENPDASVSKPRYTYIRLSGYIKKLYVKIVRYKFESFLIRKFKFYKNKYFGSKPTFNSILFYKKTTTTQNLLSGKYIYALFFIVFVILLSFMYIFYGPVFSVFIVTTMLLAMPTLLILQTMTFLYKTYRISKYTTSNQKFWKKALMVFWAIEVFLFVILLFIALNAPENLKVGVNHSVLLKRSALDDNELFDSFVITVSILLLNVYLLFLKKNKSKLTSRMTILSLLCMIWYITLSEYGQLLMCLNKSSKLSLMHNSVHNSLQPLCEIGVVENKVREDLVVNNLKLLLIFLKFWHVIFIAAFTAFKTVRFVEYGKLSYDSISAMVYNATFLVWFNVLFLILQKKKLMYLFLMKPSTCYYFQNYLKNTITIISIIIDHCTT